VPSCVESGVGVVDVDEGAVVDGDGATDVDDGAVVGAGVVVVVEVLDDEFIDEESVVVDAEGVVVVDGVVVTSPVDVACDPSLETRM
jgi:hypothetical protein